MIRKIKYEDGKEDIISSDRDTHELFIQDCVGFYREKFLSNSDLLKHFFNEDVFCDLKLSNQREMLKIICHKKWELYQILSKGEIK